MVVLQEAGARTVNCHDFSREKGMLLVPGDGGPGAGWHMIFSQSGRKRNAISTFLVLINPGISSLNLLM